MNPDFKKSLFRHALPVAGLAMLATFQANAVMFSFTGEITSFDDPQSLLPIKIPLGGAFSGTFFYDPTQGGADVTVDGSYGTYFFTNPDGSDFSLSLTVGGNTFASLASPFNRNNISVGNSVPSDRLIYETGSLLLNGGSLPNGLNDEDISLDFTDGTGTAVSNDSLPTLIPLLSIFGSASTLSFRAENNTGVVTFEGTILTVTPVPEPGEWAVIAGGLLGVFAVVRRRLGYNTR